MIWIGLTGGLASGKSTVAEMLKQKNISVINADLLARVAVLPGSDGLSKLVSHFGTDILAPDGSLDRKKMADKVFSQKSSGVSNLSQLESILHPIIRDLANKERKHLETTGHALAFYDVPLLFEKNMQKLFDKSVLVATTEESQIRRAITRDNLTESEVKARLAHQIPIDQKRKLADYIIENNQGLKELEEKVDLMLRQILNRPT